MFWMPACAGMRANQSVYTWIVVFFEATRFVPQCVV